jgi:uncharacterized membrane protein
MALGLILLIQNPDAIVPSDMLQAFSLAWRLNPYGVIDLGVAILIATPVARVVASLAHFARTGDRRFALITAYVLIIVAAGILAGAV